MITSTTVAAGGRSVENDPKSEASRRTLPLPDRLVSVLRSAKARQAAERLALGATNCVWRYVVSNEIGQPYAPTVLSRYWRETVKAAGIRHIKLHAARHTCATVMHLDGVPAAVIAAWIGHKDASLTMKLYAHSQDDALKAAGDTLNCATDDDWLHAGLGLCFLSESLIGGLAVEAAVGAMVVVVVLPFFEFGVEDVDVVDDDAVE